MKISRRLRDALGLLMKEHLSPGRAASAVFVGVFVGIIPIYGFQSVTALALAAVLRLNKPLALAATFVNNPLLQPLLIFMSVELGHFTLAGRFLNLSAAEIARSGWRQQFAIWLVGSVVLAVLAASVSGGATLLFLRWRSARREQRRFAKYVRGLFRRAPFFDRGFVSWKMRLDKVFHLLVEMDLGVGPVVDLGCGYGIALAVAHFRDSRRVFAGCDLDERRIRAACLALAPLGMRLEVDDVRTFELGHPGLILIFDVLQYLSPDEQRRLLQRCSNALVPGGRLIFRTHDTGRGLPARLSLMLDRLIFWLSKTGRTPANLAAREYRNILEGAGMAVEQRPFRNRLPLAHILFTATKPGSLA